MSRKKICIVTSKFQDYKYNSELVKFANEIKNNDIDVYIISDVYAMDKLNGEKDIYKFVFFCKFDAVITIDDSFANNMIIGYILKYLNSVQSKNCILISETNYKEIEKKDDLSTLLANSFSSFMENKSQYSPNASKPIADNEKYILLEQSLMECMSVEDYVNTLKENIDIIYNPDNMYLTLYREWWLKKKTERMFAYDIKSDARLLFFEEFLFFDSIAQDEAAIFLLLPVFFSDPMPGFVIFQDTEFSDYSRIMEIISYTLKLQTARYNVDTITENKNISDLYDKTTGFLTAKGFDVAVENYKMTKPEDPSSFMIMIKFFFSEKDIQMNKIVEGTKVINSMSQTINKILKNDFEFFSKTNDNTIIFTTLNKYDNEYLERLEELITILILNNDEFVKKYGIDSFVSASSIFDLSVTSADTIINALSSNTDLKYNELLENKKSDSYSELSELRNQMYISPPKDDNIDDICKKMCLGLGYFRNTYKKIFGCSYHKDYTNAVFYKAAYLLITTNVSVYNIAEKCGYEDEKYFIKSFKKNFLFTPSKYRELFKINNNE